MDYDFDKELRGDDEMSVGTQTANAAAAVSIPAWVVSLAADALPIVQLCAGVIAIIAGVFAIVVHWRKLRRE